MSLTTIDNNNIFHKDVIGNVRKAQEDSHDIAALTPNGDIFVVCDGMGGHVGGKQASSIAVRSIIEYLKKERYSQPVQALNDALQFANMQILGYANEHPELKGMGTTACIVLLQDSEVYITHVGDSRIYLYLGNEKQLHRITKDHSFVQTLIDTGQITDEQAEHHPDKNRILKALGIKPDLTPSFDKVSPKNGDVFLICSDGLSGMISDSAIRDVLMKNTSIEQKGETLINLALAAGGPDNITLELIQIANSPHVRSVFRSYNPVAAKIHTQYNKWKYIASLVAVIIIVLLLCIVLIYNHTVKGIETKMQDTKAEIAKIDSLIRMSRDRIKESEQHIIELTTKYKLDVSILKDADTRKEREKIYHEQREVSSDDIIKANKEMDIYNTQRDSLIQIYNADSTQLVNLKWKNKFKIKQ